MTAPTKSPEKSSSTTSESEQVLSSKSHSPKVQPPKVTAPTPKPTLKPATPIAKPIAKSPAKPAAPVPKPIEKPVAKPSTAVAATPSSSPSARPVLKPVVRKDPKKSLCAWCQSLWLPDSLDKWGREMARIHGNPIPDDQPVPEDHLCCYNCTMREKAKLNGSKKKEIKMKGNCILCPPERSGKFSLEKLQEWGAKYALLMKMNPEDEEGNPILCCYNCYHSAESKAHKASGSPSATKDKVKGECEGCHTPGNEDTLIKWGKSLAEKKGMEYTGGHYCYNCERRLTKEMNPQSPSSKTREKCPVPGCSHIIDAKRLRANGGICGFCKRKQNSAPKQMACKNPECGKVRMARTIKNNGGYCGSCKDKIKYGTLQPVEEDAYTEASEDGGDINPEEVEVTHETDGEEGGYVQVKGDVQMEGEGGDQMEREGQVDGESVDGEVNA